MSLTDWSPSERQNYERTGIGKLLEQPHECLRVVRFVQAMSLIWAQSVVNLHPNKPTFARSNDPHATRTHALVVAVARGEGW